MSQLSWKKISESVTRVGHRSILSKTFTLPNQSEQKIFDIVDGGISACVVALTKDKKIIITEQYRPGPEKILFEIPGGSVDKNETPAEAIKREFLEETGYTGNFHYLGKTYRSAYSTGIKHFFAAENCIKVSQPFPSPDEVIKVKTVSVDEFIKIINKGEMTDLDGALLGLAYLKEKGLIKKLN